MLIPEGGRQLDVHSPNRGLLALETQYIKHLQQTILFTLYLWKCLVAYNVPCLCPTFLLFPDFPVLSCPVFLAFAFQFLYPASCCALSVPDLQSVCDLFLSPACFLIESYSSPPACLTHHLPFRPPVLLLPVALTSAWPATSPCLNFCTQFAWTLIPLRLDDNITALPELPWFCDLFPCTTIKACHLLHPQDCSWFQSVEIDNSISLNRCIFFHGKWR